MFSAALSAAGKIALPVVLALAATGLAQNASTPAPEPAPTPTQTAPAPATPPAAASSSPKVEDQDSFTVVGVTIRTNNAKEAGGQGAIPQLWQNAMQNGTLDPIPNKAGEGLAVVYSDYATDSTGDYNYTLGYRVSSADKIPDGMVARTVRAGKYAVIASETGPPQEVIPALWHRIAQMTPQQLGGARVYQTDFEVYGNITDWSNMQMVAHIGVK
jgi:predicted transcriptional regulator YdeE